MLVKLYEAKNESIDYEIWIDTNGIKKISLEEFGEICLFIERPIATYKNYKEQHILHNKLLRMSKTKMNQNGKLIEKMVILTVVYTTDIKEYKPLLTYDHLSKKKISYIDNIGETKNQEIIIKIFHSLINLDNNISDFLLKYNSGIIRKYKRTGGE